MEYYNYNSNQQQIQEYHNKKELERFKYFFSQETLNFSFYINDILIDFKINYDYAKSFVLKFSCDNLLNEFKNNIKSNKYNRFCKESGRDEEVCELSINYYSYILKKQISYKCSFIYKEDLPKIHFDLYITEMLHELLEKELFNEVLLFIYDNLNATPRLIYSYLSDNDDYDYKERSYLREIIKRDIKSLSEKRRMKSILENF